MLPQKFSFQSFKSFSLFLSFLFDQTGVLFFKRKDKTLTNDGGEKNPPKIGDYCPTKIEMVNLLLVFEIGLRMI
jgi:hypothetical protein